MTHKPDQYVPALRAKAVIRLLLGSLLFGIPGMALIHNTGADIRAHAFGCLLLFGGMILGTSLIYVSANRFLKSERKIFQEHNPKLQRKIRTRRSLLFRKHYPYRNLFVSIIICIVCVAILCGGFFKLLHSLPIKRSDAMALIVIGGSTSLISIPLAIWTAMMIFLNRWSSYWDTRVAKINRDIEQLQSRTNTSQPQ